MQIRKAIKGDEDQVLQLLGELNPQVNTKRWIAFFDYHYGSGQQYFGYVLDVQGKIEGFIGTVIADRIYKGQTLTFCNIHGWIVREKYKSQSLKLITEVLKEDMIFTCFSAMELTQMILKRLKFFYIDHAYRIFHPTISLRNKSASISLVKNEADILDQHDRKIFNTHKSFPSVFVTISIDEKQCLLVFKPEYYLPGILKPVAFLFPKKFKRLLKLEYISDKSLYSAFFPKSAFKIMLKTKCFGFILSKNDLELAGIGKSKKYFGQRPYMYRYDKEKLGAAIPDTLYSEMFVLNHKG